MSVIASNLKLEFGISSAASLVNLATGSSLGGTPRWTNTADVNVALTTGYVGANFTRLTSAVGFDSGWAPTSEFTVITGIEIKEAEFYPFLGCGNSGANFPGGPHLYYLGTTSTNKRLNSIGANSNMAQQCGIGWQVMGLKYAVGGACQVFGGWKATDVLTSLTSTDTDLTGNTKKLGILSNYTTSTTSATPKFSGIEIWNSALSDADFVEACSAYRQRMKVRGIPIL